MLLRRFYHDTIAQASYMLGCQATGEALIIDPNRDIDLYIQAAEREGVRITGVTETHIHADFVSGAYELAQRTGAQLYLSGAGPADWQYAFAAAANAILLHDGDLIKVGNVRVNVLHTPGHTPEHIAFLVTDAAHTEQPIGVFTGDFVFVGDVGRPDLLERAAGIAGTMEAGASQLFHSLQRFKQLPDHLQIWPGHGAGSACGRALGAVPQTTLGYERLTNWALQIDDEQEFVANVLRDQPTPPPYFAQMKRINKLGPALRPSALPAALTLNDLQHLRESGVQLVDARSAPLYASGHIPGSINIPVGDAFVTWAGWLLSYAQPIALIAEPETWHRLHTELLIIGLDNLVGLGAPALIAAWQAAGEPLTTFARQPAERVYAELQQRDATLVDVRTPSEYASGHLPQSQNIPLGQLAMRLNEIPRDRPVLVYCQSGGRSPIAASLLTANGWSQVQEMCDGFAGWQAARYPTSAQSMLS